MQEFNGNYQQSSTSSFLIAGTDPDWNNSINNLSWFTVNAARFRQPNIGATYCV